MGRQLTMVQIPDRSRLNPALDLYREALTAAGARVQSHDLYPRPSGRPALSIRWLLVNAGKVDVIHFHWFQQLYLSGFRLTTAVRFSWFAAKLALARLLGFTISWTVHNLDPHERPHARIDALELLSYENFETTKTELMQGMGKTLDISMGGLCFESSHALPLGSNLKLSIARSEEHTSELQSH